MEPEKRPLLPVSFRRRGSRISPSESSDKMEDTPRPTLFFFFFFFSSFDFHLEHPGPIHAFSYCSGNLFRRESERFDFSFFRFEGFSEVGSLFVEMKLGVKV